MMELLAIAGLGVLFFASGGKEKKTNSLKGVDQQKVSSKVKGNIRTFEL
ncbi:hypothetical protein [Algivirga pacifica]